MDRRRHRRVKERGKSWARDEGGWTWPKVDQDHPRGASISNVIAVRNSCDKSTIGILYGEYEAASCTSYGANSNPSCYTFQKFNSGTTNMNFVF